MHDRGNTAPLEIPPANLRIANAKYIVTESLPTSLQDCVAGSFHKTALLQKRVRELIKGASPLIDTREKNPIRIALIELQQGLIELVPDEEIHPILMNPVAGLGAVATAPVNTPPTITAPAIKPAAPIVNDASVFVTDPLEAKNDDAAETNKSVKPEVETPEPAPG